MILSTLCVVLGLSAAARFSRDADDDTLERAMGNMALSDEVVDSLAEAIVGVLEDGRRGVCGHEKEYKKLQKMLPLFKQQLCDFDKDVSIFLFDVFKYKKSLEDDFKGLIKTSPSGQVTGPRLASVFTKKHIKKLQLESNKLETRLVKLRERESTMLTSMESLINKECDLYFSRMIGNLESLAPLVEDHYNKAAFAYSLFETEVAYMQWGLDSANQHECGSYTSRIIDFANIPFTSLILLSKKFDHSQFEETFDSVQAAVLEIHYRCSSIAPMMLMDMAFKIGCLSCHRHTVDRFTFMVNQRCAAEDVGAALAIKCVFDLKLKSGPSDAVIDDVPVSVKKLVAKSKPEMNAAVVDAWEEGAVERVGESLQASVATLMSEGVTVPATFDASGFAAIQRNAIQIHRDMHSRIATAKERRNSVVAPVSTDDVSVAFRAIFIDELAAKINDHGIVESVSRELVALIAQQPSASVATNTLTAKLREQRDTLARLEKSLSDLRAAHIKSLEKISDAEASVSVYETQLLSFLPPPGVAMDAKVAKKWDRAIASHATAINSLNDVLSAAIATLTSIVNTAADLRAVQSRIFAVDLAIIAVRNVSS